LKNYATHYHKKMITVTIVERILMKEGVKTAQITLIFVGNGSYA